MTYLFEDFLDDPIVYLQNEAYYKALFIKVIGEEPSDYYNTTFNNKKKFFDGNPIFSTKYNDRLIRIIQEEPESDKPYFKVRIETKEDGTDELVINLELSKEVEPQLIDYYNKWFKEKLNITTIKKDFNPYLSESKPIIQDFSEPELLYQKRSEKPNQLAIALNLYTKELSTKAGVIANPELLKAVTKACGPSIYNKDSSRISFSDPKELDRVKKNFLIRKLGLDDSSQLDKAIKEVGEQLGIDNRNKYRAMFYYLLVIKFKKEALFLK